MSVPESQSLAGLAVCPTCCQFFKSNESLERVKLIIEVPNLIKKVSAKQSEAFYRFAAFYRFQIFIV